MRGNDDAATDLLQIPATNLEVSKIFFLKINAKYMNIKIIASTIYKNNN